MLIDKDMIKKDLRLQTGFSTTTMSKLSKDENVSMDVLEKICSVLNCDVGDIMDHSYPYMASLTRDRSFSMKCVPPQS